ncbi:MAG: glycosyltransferase family 4 protein [Bacteroidia bacterium]|nr:glycosyltransferase family 4 protein [Bacteroidia bacterium]
MNPDIRFVCPAGIKHPELAKQLGAKIVRPFAGHLWEQLTLPMWLQRQGNPLLINLGNTGLLNYDEQIVTIHDMAFKVQPLWFARSFQLWYDYLIPRIANNSRLILTVSNSSKNDIVKFTKVDPEKIHVIYNAIPESFTKKFSEEGINISSLPEKYILYVGAINPRKNLAHMVEAYNLLQREDVKLLMIGEEHASFADYQLQQLYKDKADIMLKSKLTDEELICTYKRASALINVSYHEGFGLPLLEAMHLGCPVICSDIPAYREIFGDAAILVDPTSAEAIRNAINDVLNMNGALNSKIEKGKILASQFSYRRSAEKIINCINNL